MINKIRDNIFQLHFNEFGSCVYVLRLEASGEEKIVLIDTSTRENKEELTKDLDSLGISLKDVNYILLTHTHYDHIGNNSLFPNAKIISKKEIEDLRIEVIGTPGHTSDSVCYIYGGILFSGDTLFHNGIGRTDLPTGDYEEITKSLEKIRNLDFEVLCPGHID